MAAQKMEIVGTSLVDEADKHDELFDKDYMKVRDFEMIELLVDCVAQQDVVPEIKHCFLEV